MGPAIPCPAHLYPRLRRTRNWEAARDRHAGLHAIMADLKRQVERVASSRHDVRFANYFRTATSCAALRRVLEEATIKNGA